MRDKCEDKDTLHNKNSTNGIRGTLEPNDHLIEFFDRFPDLLWDDPEDKFNEIIGILRNTALNYYNI